MACCCCCSRSLPVSAGTSLWVYNPTARAVTWRRPDPVVSPFSPVLSASVGRLLDGSGEYLVGGYTPASSPEIEARRGGNYLGGAFNEETLLAKGPNLTDPAAHGGVYMRTIGPYPEPRIGPGTAGEKTELCWFTTANSSATRSARRLVQFTPTGGSPTWILETYTDGIETAMNLWPGEEMIPPKDEGPARTIFYFGYTRPPLNPGRVGTRNKTIAPGAATTEDFDLNIFWELTDYVAGPDGDEYTHPWSVGSMAYCFDYEGGVVLRSWDIYTAEELDQVSCDIPSVCNRGWMRDGLLWARTADSTALYCMDDTGQSVSTFTIPSTDRFVRAPINNLGLSTEAWFPQICPGGDFLYWCAKGNPITSYDLVRVSKDTGTEVWRINNASTQEPKFTVPLGDAVFTSLPVSGGTQTVHIDESGTIVWRSPIRSGVGGPMSAAALIDGGNILMAGYLPP